MPICYMTSKAVLIAYKCFHFCCFKSIKVLWFFIFNIELLLFLSNFLIIAFLCKLMHSFLYGCMYSLHTQHDNYLTMFSMVSLLYIYNLTLQICIIHLITFHQHFPLQLWLQVVFNLLAMMSLPMVESSELRTWVDRSTGVKTLWHVKVHDDKWETWYLGIQLSIFYKHVFWFKVFLSLYFVFKLVDGFALHLRQPALAYFKKNDQPLLLPDSFRRMVHMHYLMAGVPPPADADLIS